MAKRPVFNLGMDDDTNAPEQAAENFINAAGTGEIENQHEGRKVYFTRNMRQKIIHIPVTDPELSRKRTRKNDGTNLTVPLWVEEESAINAAFAISGEKSINEFVRKTLMEAIKKQLGKGGIKEVVLPNGRVEHIPYPSYQEIISTEYIQRTEATTEEERQAERERIQRLKNM